MSAGGGENSGQEVELNLAPIIDCFTVLITYLLVTASFISLSALDVGVSASGTAAPAAPSDGPPPMVMTLNIQAGGAFVITVRGGKIKNEAVFTIQPMGGSWDTRSLDEKLAAIQTRWPELTEVSVSADPTVVHRDIVKTINEIQKLNYKVFIAG